MENLKDFAAPVSEIRATVRTSGHAAHEATVSPSPFVHVSISPCWSTLKNPNFSFHRIHLRAIQLVHTTRLRSSQSVYRDMEPPNVQIFHNLLCTRRKGVGTYLPLIRHKRGYCRTKPTRSPTIAPHGRDRALKTSKNVKSSRIQPTYACCTLFSSQRLELWGFRGNKKGSAGREEVSE